LDYLVLVHSSAEASESKKGVLSAVYLFGNPRRRTLHFEYKDFFLHLSLAIQKVAQGNQFLLRKRRRPSCRIGRLAVRGSWCIRCSRATLWSLQMAGCRCGMESGDRQPAARDIFADLCTPYNCSALKVGRLFYNSGCDVVEEARSRHTKDIEWESQNP
jgi:hypothetical protein